MPAARTNTRNPKGVDRSSVLRANILIIHPDTPTSESKQSHPTVILQQDTPCPTVPLAAKLSRDLHLVPPSRTKLKKSGDDSCHTHHSGLLDFIFTSAKYSACPGANLLVTLASGNGQSPKGIKSYMWFPSFWFDYYSSGVKFLPLQKPYLSCVP